ncbi:MAG TPA: polysaccharide pyruvyl transferase family protein [Citricoccus sp.]
MSRRSGDLAGAYRNRPAVGLVGFFGWGNYGDELFLQLWKRVLSPHFDVSVVHDLLTPPYVSRDPEAVADAYDALVIGGGDLVLTDQLSELYWRREWLRRPVYICGVGATLHDRIRRQPVIDQMAEFFGHPNVQYISARDDESAAWIRTHLRPRVPVEVHPDLVFALPLPPPDPGLLQTGGRPTLGVSVRQGKFGQDNDYSGLASLVEAARDRGYAVSVLELGNGRQRHRDTPALAQLPFVPDSVVSERSPEQISAAIGALTVSATMKFHGLVVGLRYGVPSLALSPNTKNSALLEAIGRPDLVGDLEPGLDLAPRLRALEEPWDTGTVRALERQAATALEAVVRQMRLQLNPTSYLPRSVPGLAETLEALPSAAALARRRVRLARVDRENRRARRR